METKIGLPYALKVGAHEMTITGITDDGRYEVSSWGKKLYYDPAENVDDACGFYTVKVK